MDGLDMIYSRRSIRKFTGEVISEYQLEKILKAGFAAPSAHNTQPWEFVIIKEPEILEKIAIGHPYAKMLPSAGCGIVVCGNQDNQKSVGFLVADCSAAIENMLLASHALGLGAVWCGVYPIEPLMMLMKDTLHLPKEILPIGLVVVGEKMDEKLPRDHFNPQRIHHNKW